MAKLPSGPGTSGPDARTPAHNRPYIKIVVDNNATERLSRMPPRPKMVAAAQPSMDPAQHWAARIPGWSSERSLRDAVDRCRSDVIADIQATHKDLGFTRNASMLAAMGGSAGLERLFVAVGCEWMRQQFDVEQRLGGRSDLWTKQPTAEHAVVYMERDIRTTVTRLAEEAGITSTGDVVALVDAVMQTPGVRNLEDRIRASYT